MNNGVNFDPDEISKFSHGSRQWWDLNGEFKALHDINPVRIRYISDAIDLKTAGIVDVGCGGGILAEGLAPLSRQVTGIDLNSAAIAAAREHNRFTNLAYECIDTASHASAQPAGYDVLTCMELLEHVPDPKALILSCSGLVKPGGHLFFSTINRNLSAYVKLVLAAEHLFRLLPRGTHDYGKFIRPSELAGWCRHSGLNVLDISGLEYSPVSNSFYLTRKPVTNYLLHAVKVEN